MQMERWRRCMGMLRWLGSKGQGARRMFCHRSVRLPSKSLVRVINWKNGKLLRALRVLSRNSFETGSGTREHIW